MNVLLKPTHRIVEPKITFSEPSSQFLFVVTHLGSGYEELVSTLNENPRIDLQETTISYSHPKDLEYIKLHGHKLGSMEIGGTMVPIPKIYGDVLLFNYCFSCKAMYKFCKFIYFIQNAVPAISEILKDKNYTPEQAYLYYSYRLRRICEMAKNTPGAILMTWNDLANGRCFEMMEKYLSLKEPLVAKQMFSPKLQDFPSEFVQKAEDCFERHYYYLRNLPLNQ